MSDLEKKYRTLFISDLHLGLGACQADLFLEFFKTVKAEKIYLVGDIIDFWRIRRKPQWYQSHNDVIQKLLRRVRKGTEMIYVPGNHDEILRAYCKMDIGGIKILRNDIHETADGRKFLIIHGDEFDIVVKHARWLALLGDWSYNVALWLNTHFNWIRRQAGLEYWSLSAYLKQRVKQAVNFIGEFENALSLEAEQRKVDGVICGHIHQVAMKKIDDVLYLNTGDWVESCTALGETFDGKFEIIRWVNGQSIIERELDMQVLPDETPVESVAAKKPAIEDAA